MHGYKPYKAMLCLRCPNIYQNLVILSREVRLLKQLWRFINRVEEKVTSEINFYLSTTITIARSTSTIAIPNLTSEINFYWPSEINFY